MSDFHTGIYGAKVMSWNEYNPRDIFDALMNEMPDASKDEQLAAVRERVKLPENEPYLNVIIEYWFANAYASRHRLELYSKSKSVEHTEKARALKEKVKEHIKQKVFSLI